MPPEEFAKLLQEMRPRLHRYCARMVGSAIDGEDVVQEVLAKAAEAYPTAGEIERPESWLLRIAHNAALDALRRSKRQADLHTETDLDLVEDSSSAADARVAATASLAALLHLPPAQRSSVVLMDVLGHSLAETAEIIQVSVPAVKAALHRGRARLQGFAGDDAVPMLDATERVRLQEYADRFNARDFDALRALLAEDVQLDLVNRSRLAGRKDVGVYFTRYSELQGWTVEPTMFEDRAALLVRDPEGAPSYVVLLTWRDGKIASIRDFHYARYVMDAQMQEKRRVL
jgi:RNA polymerase sigma-70 factor (ECF subfamily)